MAIVVRHVRVLFVGNPDDVELVRLLAGTGIVVLPESRSGDKPEGHQAEN
jgi:hypothetical protein